MAAGSPVWGADTQISMPVPTGDDIQVPMYGFGMTQYRLVHDITAADAEQLKVPTYAPAAYFTAIQVPGDADVDS